jgi:hypothetical protein
LSLPQALRLVANLQVAQVNAHDWAITPRVPAYWTFAVRLAWQYKHWEVPVVGQSLWDDRHAEFGALEILRSGYGKVAWRL